MEGWGWCGHEEGLKGVDLGNRYIVVGLFWCNIYHKGKGFINTKLQV